jgi:hypothetical protein
MKTILVVYTNKLLSKSEIAKAKKYSFNTSTELKEGDMFSSPSYFTYLQVVKVLDKDFKYYNASTGELSDTFNSTAQWEIRTLVIREDEEEVIYGSLIKQNSIDIKK